MCAPLVFTTVRNLLPLVSCLERRESRALPAAPEPMQVPGCRGDYLTYAQPPRGQYRTAKCRRNGGRRRRLPAGPPPPPRRRRSVPERERGSRSPAERRRSRSPSPAPCTSRGAGPRTRVCTRCLPSASTGEARSGRAAAARTSWLGSSQSLRARSRGSCSATGNGATRRCWASQRRRGATMTRHSRGTGPTCPRKSGTPPVSRALGRAVFPPWG